MRNRNSTFGGVRGRPAKYIDKGNYNAMLLVKNRLKLIKR
jgi:hypothetical protein